MAGREGPWRDRCGLGSRSRRYRTEKMGVVVLCRCIPPTFLLDLQRSRSICRNIIIIIREVRPMVVRTRGRDYVVGGVESGEFISKTNWFRLSFNRVPLLRSHQVLL